MTEEGLVGSRYAATVVAVEGSRVQIEHEAFNEEAEDGGESEVLLKEWVALKQLTPPPAEAK